MFDINGFLKRGLTVVVTILKVLEQIEETEFRASLTCVLFLVT